MNNGVNKNAIYWLLLLSLPFLAISLIIAVNANNRNNNLSDNNLSDGKSAYELAVDKGFIGSEQDWLNFIKGTNGDSGLSAYEIAVEDGFQGTIEEWLESLTGRVGEDGENQLSDFEIAQANGFTGTLEQFLVLIDDAIKGDAKGESGKDGKDALSLVDINYELIPGIDGNDYVVCDFFFSDGSMNKRVCQVEKEIEDFDGLYPYISTNTTNPMFLVRKDLPGGISTVELLDTRLSEFGKGGELSPGSHSAEFRYGSFGDYEYTQYYVFKSDLNSIPGGGKKGIVTENEGNKYTIYIELEKDIYAFPFLNVSDPYNWRNQIDIYGYVYEKYDNGNVTCTYRKLNRDTEYYLNIDYYAQEKEYKSVKNKQVSYAKYNITLRYQYIDDLTNQYNNYNEYKTALYFYDPENIELVSVRAFNKRYDTKNSNRYFNLSNYENKEALFEDYLSDLYFEKIYSDGTIEYQKIEKEDIVNFNYPTDIYSPQDMRIDINLDGYENFVQNPTSDYKGTKMGTNNYSDYIRLVKNEFGITEYRKISSPDGIYRYDTSKKFQPRQPLFKYNIDELNYKSETDTLYVTYDGEYHLPSFISNFEYSIPVLTYFTHYSSIYCINYKNFNLTFEEFISSIEIDEIVGNTVYFYPTISYNGETLKYGQRFKLIIVDALSTIKISYDKYETDYFKTPYSTDPLEYACVVEKAKLSGDDILVLERVISLKELKELNPDVILNLNEIEVDEDGFMVVSLKGTDKNNLLVYDMFKRENGSSTLDLYLYQEGNASDIYSKYITFNDIFNEFEVSEGTYVEEFLYLDLIMSSSIKYIHEASPSDTKLGVAYDNMYIPIKAKWVNLKNVPQENGRFTTPGRYEFTIKLGIFDYEIKGYINVVPSVLDMEPIYTYDVDLSDDVFKNLYALKLNIDLSAYDSIKINLYENNTLNIEYYLNGLLMLNDSHLYEIKNNMIYLSIDDHATVSLPFIINGSDLEFIGEDPMDYDFNIHDLDGKEYFFNLVSDDIVQVASLTGDGEYQITFLFYKYDEAQNKYVINSSNMRLYYQIVELNGKMVDALQVSPIRWN